MVGNGMCQGCLRRTASRMQAIAHAVQASMLTLDGSDDEDCSARTPVVKPRMAQRIGWGSVRGLVLREAG